MHEIHIGLHPKIDLSFIFTQEIETEDSHRPRTKNYVFGGIYVSNESE